MKRLIVLLICLLFAVVVSCSKDSKDKKDKPTPKPPVEQPKPPEPPPAEIADNDLAVPADFEEEAEAEIDKKNYKAELDTLEKEIETEE